MTGIQPWKNTKFLYLDLKSLFLPNDEVHQLSLMHDIEEPNQLRHCIPFLPARPIFLQYQLEKWLRGPAKM